MPGRKKYDGERILAGAALHSTTGLALGQQSTLSVATAGSSANTRRRAKRGSAVARSTDTPTSRATGSAFAWQLDGWHSDAGAAAMPAAEDGGCGAAGVRRTSNKRGHASEAAQCANKVARLMEQQPTPICSNLGAAHATALSDYTQSLHAGAHPLGLFSSLLRRPAQCDCH